MVHFILRVIAVITLLYASTAQAEPRFSMQPEQVASGIYAVIPPTRELPNPQNRGWNSNSAFIVTGDGVLVVDTGSSTEIGESLKTAIAGVTDQPVRWILNTHAHGDHWLGNAAFENSVEKIYATPPVIDQIRSQGENWVANFKRLTDGATGNSRIVPPDTPIDSRQELQLGNKAIVLFPSGDSHSPGDLLLWLPDDKVLISGDVIYSDRMPSTNNSNLQQWIKLLPELEQLQPEVVIPGHGSITDVRGIEQLHKLLTALWQSVEEGYHAGLAAYETVPLVRERLADFAETYPGMDEKLPRDVPRVYLQVEAATF
ncbi:MBL fold metallo-hydrolase [Thiohalophilus thiocyanatoxydans]|uniref:Glyoxylase-like metal-dependent hydrolase (Beta-lactamase superfamily II) n=1 Tax=Thiohalophilus thiocyanatoxydans TaxID=381308 RepID=A0A4R8IN44_9GAMM|nr:MBL fold metallo-hydrolase [Thiohalophilus thiocyanatoxydans]TDY00530.1 glyoxylase-like metal-dependent hydrolase (beta-lactamase superfamily II) [Thiohalophilus thiocyanatoxydans]